MTEDEIRRVVQQTVAQTLAAERVMRPDEDDEVILKTISTILTSFGMDDEDRKEIRLDFAHLRKWRKSMERVENVGWTAAVGFIATGLLAALWLGIKASVGK